MDPIVIVLASAGIGSTVAAATFMGRAALYFLHIDYGQPAAGAERLAAETIAAALAGQFRSLTLPALDDPPATGSTGRRRSAVSRESRTQPTSPSAGTMLTMLGAAARVAEQIGAERIVCGASSPSGEPAEGVASDEAFRRRGFLQAARTVIEAAMPGKRKLVLETPLEGVSPSDVIRLGQRLGAPLHLTWSCPRAEDTPCGRCAGCTSRAAAFAGLGVPDPANALHAQVERTPQVGAA